MYPSKNKTKNKSSVALKYNVNIDNAPKITAKGKGYLSYSINKIAKDNNIPIIENKVLSELLIKNNLNDEIPLAAYAIVAEIYNYLNDIKKKP